MNQDIQSYNNTLSATDKAIADFLAKELTTTLPEAMSFIWHAHPVWFIEKNPVAGYSKLKNSIRLLFWSGQSFDEPLLKPEGKFKAAEIRYTHIQEVHIPDLKRWIEKCRNIQWDYQNIVKRKGELLRLK